MSKTIRTIILIDGSNFYFKLKDLGLQDLLAFDFGKFASHLASNTKIVQATYYVGAVQTSRSKKSKLMHAKQRQLLAHLQKHNFTYYLGYLLKSDGVFKEKGVDVKLATDLLLGACQDKYDQAFVVSSDSDLIPAIEGAQDLGKKITYIGFKHQVSYSLSQHTKNTTLLTKSDILQFI